ncbi:MAG: nucleotidyltransferase domain-containing protein [Thaumarchaeota archaeon]|nr:nucleotidyltransferase domain-containing protein [Nitrososphaerota archaeon]
MALRDFSDVLASKAGIRVIRALVKYKGKVFTVRELARTAGVTHPEVSLVARRLEERGMVKIQPVGNALQIILNDESYIIRSAAEPLVRAEEGAVKELVATIRPFLDSEPVISAAIFGSVARGEEKKTSDVDLLVVTRDKEKANESVAEASARVISKFGVGLSPLIMDDAQFMRGRGIVGSVLESYVMVAGQDLERLVRRRRR